MDDLAILRVVDLVAGAIGGLAAIGLIFAPRVVEWLEKKLDYNFSTHSLEETLNKRKEISSLLLQRSRVIGLILLVISFFLLMTGIILI
jgi:hypothetical protein